MDTSLIAQNLLSPPILFFALGLLAAFLRSDLAIPPAVSKGLSVYLLFAIGFHGGVELSRSGFGTEVVVTLTVAALASALLPVWCFVVLRWRLNAANAAAIAACYGSISAVTFITAVGFLDSMEVSYSGFLVATMALMETPAIIVGILLARWAGSADGQARRPWRQLLHESLCNGAVLLLLGSMVIGYLTGESGEQAMAPVVKDVFKGALALFLLDMGLTAAQRMGQLRQAGVFLSAFSVVVPAAHAVLGIAVAATLGLGKGDALLLAVLFGSASYIAVPAAMRMALPQANPSLYIPMSLGVTFPLNIIIGIPLYFTIIQWLWQMPA